MNAHQPVPYTALSMYIDGHFIGEDDRHSDPVFNPADDTILGYLPHAASEDLDLALDAAARAFDQWRWTSPLERSRSGRRRQRNVRRLCDHEVHLEGYSLGGWVWFHCLGVCGLVAFAEALPLQPRGAAANDV